MTFAHRCEAIYGRFWRTRLARDIRRDRSQVWRWEHGKTPVPHWVLMHLERLEQHKSNN